MYSHWALLMRYIGDMEYYIIVNGQNIGPIVESQMLDYGLTRNTYVWRSGMPQWQLAGNMPELVHLFGDVPPQPPVEQPLQQSWPGAIAGLVLGICSIYFCSIPVIGLLLGFFGLRVTKDSYAVYKQDPMRYSNGGILRGGRIVSYIGLVIGIVCTTVALLLLLLVVFGAIWFSNGIFSYEI